MAAKAKELKWESHPAKCRVFPNIKDTQGFLQNVQKNPSIYQKRATCCPFWGGGAEGLWEQGEGAQFSWCLPCHSPSAQTQLARGDTAAELRRGHCSHRILVTLQVRMIQDCNPDLEDKAQQGPNKPEQQ